MTTLPIGEAKDRFSALAEEVERTHEIVHITRHGRRSVAVIAEDDLDSLHETIFWLSQPGIREDLAASEREFQRNDIVAGDDLRREFGLGPGDG